MYDAVLYYAEKAEKAINFPCFLQGLTNMYHFNDKSLHCLSSKNFYLATIHRAENTDSSQMLNTILFSLNSLDGPVIFPIHPRTYGKVKSLNINLPNIIFTQPVGYLEMLMLTKNARKVLTDSGGLQKEAFFLDTPCVTLREETEWVETLIDGWNILTPINSQSIITKAQEPFVESKKQKKEAFGNGFATHKIIKLIEQIL